MVRLQVACEQTPKKTASEASREGPRGELKARELSPAPSLPTFFPSPTPSFFLPRSFRPILDRRACSQASLQVKVPGWCGGWSGGSHEVGELSR